MGAESQEGSRSAAGSQAVAGMSPDAAGSASGPQGDDGGDRLISVNVNVNGAERTVESSGMMVLQDLQGELRYTITADQYATIAARVRSPEFAAAMDDPQDCHMITDGGLQRVTVQWTDIGMQIDSAAASCFDPPEQSNHIYNRLLWALVDLQAQYLTCPSVNNSRELCRGCSSWGPSACRAH